MIAQALNPPVWVRFAGPLGDPITDAISSAAAGAIRQAVNESWPDIQAKLEASAGKFWADAEASMRREMEARGYQIEQKVQPWAYAMLGLGIVGVILTGIVIARQR